MVAFIEHAEGHGDKMFAAVCDQELEGVVSKKLNAPYRSGPSKSWIKVMKGAGGDGSSGHFLTMRAAR